LVAAFALCACALVFNACDDGSGYLDLDRGDRSLPGRDLEDGGSLEGGASGEGGTGRDGGNGDRDGAIIPPGATMDAAVLGLDASLMLPDGSWILADGGGILLPDGQIIDIDAAIMRFGADPDLSKCLISDEDLWQASVDIDNEGAFSLVPGRVGFGLAYRSLGSGTCDNVEVMHIPSSSGFSEPHGLLTDCPAITDLSLTSTDSGWQLAWIDNFTNMAELHSAALDDAMQVTAAGRRTLTSNDRRLERKPVVEQIAGRPLVAWTARDTQTDQYQINAQWLDGDAQAVELIADGEEHQPQGIALSQIDADAAAVGWVGPESNPGVWLLRLDARGERVGNPIKLTERVAVSSSIDLAGRDEGGAAVYSIEIDGIPQVRFRRLDQTGVPVADERVLVGPPFAGKDASLFPLGGGYAVAYRALPGASIDAPEIRLLFVSRDGAVMRDSAGSPLSVRIAAATQASARTHLAVSVEGQIMISWLDDDPSSDNNALKVARRRLDCR
jgi:hypothetical protein